MRQSDAKWVCLPIHFTALKMREIYVIVCVWRELSLKCMVCAERIIESASGYYSIQSEFRRCRSTMSLGIIHALSYLQNSPNNPLVGATIHNFNKAEWNTFNITINSFPVCQQTFFFCWIGEKFFLICENPFMVYVSIVVHRPTPIRSRRKCHESQTSNSELSTITYLLNKEISTCF